MGFLRKRVSQIIHFQDVVMGKILIQKIMYDG